MKEYLRKYPRLFKILSWTKENIVEPFTTGFLWNYFIYLISISKREKNYLKINGFESLSVFKTRSWRFHEGIDGANRRYYIATLGGKKCFIKIANSDLTIENEIFIAKLVQKYEWNFTSKCLYIDETTYSDGKVLALEFINDLHEFKLPSSKQTFRLICDEYLEILNALETAGIVHADVHRRNLLMDSNNHIYILDFGISAIEKKGNKIDYLARPGTFFKTNGNTRIYDDAYSFIMMTQNLGISKEFEELEEYTAIRDRIGKITYTVQI